MVNQWKLEVLQAKRAQLTRVQVELKMRLMLLAIATPVVLAFALEEVATLLSIFTLVAVVVVREKVLVRQVAAPLAPLPRISCREKGCAGSRLRCLRLETTSLQVYVAPVISKEAPVWVKRVPVNKQVAS